MPEGNNQTTLTLRECLTNGACLFDTENRYPIWKEEDRAELEEKIISHYWMRQIGFETFGRFRYELNVRMREIMPGYVKRWDTTQFKYNPIENYNMTEGSEDNTRTKDTSTGTSSVNSMDKTSDTPLSEVSNIDDYMTNVNQSENKGQSTNTNDGTHDTKHTAWRKGNIGVMSTQNLIQQERDIIIDLYREIIHDLRDLFLGVM